MRATLSAKIWSQHFVGVLVVAFLYPWQRTPALMIIPASRAIYRPCQAVRVLGRFQCDRAVRSQRSDGQQGHNGGDDALGCADTAGQTVTAGEWRKGQRDTGRDWTRLPRKFDRQQVLNRSMYHTARSENKQGQARTQRRMTPEVDHAPFWCPGTRCRIDCRWCELGCSGSGWMLAAMRRWCRP